MERNRIFKSFDLQMYPSSSRDSIVKHSESLTPILPKLPLKKNNSLNLILTPKPAIKIPQNYFPEWLLKRPDFKQILDPNSKDMDIGNICELEDKFRDELQKKELLDWCQSCVFFQSFSQYTCKEVCSRLFTKRFRPGETIIKEGETGDCMYIIVKGRIDIQKQGKHLDTVVGKNVIGETALESNCLRSATVISRTETTALVLNKEDYHKILSRQKHMLRSDIVNLLKKIPVFQDMMVSKLERMAWLMLIMHYPAGHTIYKQQQSTAGIYFIKEGSVNLIFDVTIKFKGKIPGKQNLEIGDKTCHLLVKTVNKGDFFGEEELFEGIQRKTKAVCAENSVILFIKEKKFLKSLLEKEKELVGSVHQKMKSSRMLAKECLLKYKNEKIMSQAMFEATCQSDSYRSKIVKGKKFAGRKVFGSNLSFKQFSDNFVMKNEF